MLHPFKYFTRSLSLKKPLSNTICYLPRFYNTKSEQEESTSFGVYEFNGCKFPVKFKSFTSIYSQEDMEPLNSGRVSLISGVPTDALRQDIQRYIKSLFNIDIELDNIFPVYGPTMRFKNQYLLQFKTPEEANAVVTHETQAKYRFSKDSEIRITKTADVLDYCIKKYAVTKYGLQKAEKANRSLFLNVYLSQHPNAIPFKKTDVYKCIPYSKEIESLEEVKSNVLRKVYLITTECEEEAYRILRQSVPKWSGHALEFSVVK